MSEFSTLNKTYKANRAPSANTANTIAVTSAKVRNVEEILEYEQKLKERLNEANAAGEAIVYPVALRTKYCACKYNAETDCRYHSSKEPGWEICPEIQSKEQIGALKNGRWLYITTGEPVNQDDPTEIQDAALEKRLSKELINAVS